MRRRSKTTKSVQLVGHLPLENIRIVEIGLRGHFNIWRNFHYRIISKNPYSPGFRQHDTVFVGTCERHNLLIRKIRWVNPAWPVLPCHRLGLQSELSVHRIPPCKNTIVVVNTNLSAPIRRHYTVRKACSYVSEMVSQMVTHTLVRRANRWPLCHIPVDHENYYPTPIVHDVVP